jgi:acetate kinase
MIVLVANLGSTSFKYKLFDMPAAPGSNNGGAVVGGEKLLATGATDRIGQGGSTWSVTAGQCAAQGQADIADHGQAVALHLRHLKELGAIGRIEDVQAIGFKAVHGGPISGAVRVNEQVLATMQQFADVAPAHNPPYIAAMKAFAKDLPGVPQVAAFETAYHQTIPLSRQIYAIPHAWTEAGVRRYGFHGASHRYIATRMRQIAPDARRIISCHLGGSCSICAIQDGRSVANSFGMTAQSGVFHNNRVGDFDSFALLKLLTIESGDLDAIFRKLGKEGGLLGISGLSADLREVEVAAAKGDGRAKLAVEAFIESCRHYVGAYLAVLNGADAIVFTGGIGQHGRAVRAGICNAMEYAGVVLDTAKNDAAGGDAESRIDAAGSKVQLWVLPTNEELIVARQAVEVLSAN